MQYHCVQCDQSFDVADGEDKPRCPKCLRTHGLRRLESRPPRVAATRGVGMYAAMGLIGLIVVGYIVWDRTSRSDEAAAGGVLDSEALSEQLRSAAGIDVGDAAKLFVADDALEAFAEQATSGKDSDDDKLRAVARAMKARAAKQAFVPWSLLEPRERPAELAAAAWARLAKDGAREELYPLEVAAVAVAALRSVDVPAVMFEVHAFAGERAPLDPSGRLGYYAVGLPAPAAEAGDSVQGSSKPARVVDVYGGREQAPKPGDFAALSDTQAVAGLLALRAMQRLAHGNDPAGALSLADAASKLSPSSASVRGVRGAVLLASGGKDEGTRELEAAAQLHAGAAQQNNLAVLALATGDTERATKTIARALADSPDFASAHLTLASVHLARVERDQARAELMQAERLDPRLPALPLAWAELHAGSGDLMQAVQKAQEGIQLRPKSPEAHLLLARIYRQSGRYDEMRQEARKVLELSPSMQQEQVRSVLRAILGPTALEASEAEDEPAQGGDVAGDVGAADPALPRLAPADEDPGALQLGAGEPKLRLGDDSKLKLDLSR